MNPNLSINTQSKQKQQKQQKTASQAALNDPMPMPGKGKDGLSGVYWVGANGNIYFQNNDGKVRDMGKGTASGAGGFDAASGSAAARLISDPNASKNTQRTPAPTDPYGGAGGSGYPDLSGAINILRQNISALDPIYNSNVNNANQGYNTANNERIAAYDRTKVASDASGISNDQNVLQSRNAISKSTRMSSENIASLLGSIGMGGSTTGKAMSTIADKSNGDLNSANYGYGKNKQSILQSWNDYTIQDGNQQKQLVDSKNYNIAQAGIQRGTAKKDALGQIASNQIQMGQGTGDILAEMAGVNNEIAGLSTFKNTYDGKSATYKAPSIGEILGPNQANYAVNAGAPGAVGTGLAPKIVKVNEQNKPNEKYGLVA